MSFDFEVNGFCFDFFFLIVNGFCGGSWLGFMVVDWWLMVAEFVMVDIWLVVML